MNLLCPEFYVATPTGCVKEVETEPRWSCDEGNLNGSTCEISRLHVETRKCASGFDIVDEKCLRQKHESSLLKCPLGYDLDGEECVKLLRQPARKRCLEGKVTADNTCLGSSIFPVPLVCPNNSVPDGAKCRRTMTQSAAPLCPAGTEEADEVCIKEEIQPISLVCPLSGSKPDKDGRCKTKEPPMKQCPGGWTFRGKESCVKRSVLHRELVCPQGMSLVGNHCAATEYFDPLRVCPEGTKRLNNDECVMETRLPMSLVCEPPYILLEDSEECLFSNKLLAEHQCAQGFYDENQKVCIVAEVMPVEKSCPPGTRKVRTGLDHYCEEIVYEEAHPSCPTDFVISEGVCRGKATVPGKVVCEAPFIQRDGVCIVVEKQLLEPYCDNALLKGSSCVTDREQPPAVLCPEAYTYEPGSRVCKKFLWSQPVIECSGWMWDGKVKECYTFEAPPQVGDSNPTSDDEHPTGGSPSGSPSGAPPGAPAGSNNTHPSTTDKPDESLLPMEVNVSTTTTTTTTTATVKAKVQLPPNGKENFVPIQTFTGPNAVAQAHQYEALKLQGHSSQPVYVPQVH
ncbi:putative oocyst wall protein [Gregarina niphandrodes]|uniref:Oocyst wall protein n=1 Tax=Gregarina niphandrodes TaxID=110365 RepID=A0A023B9K6_GRENI|nr:putative oocyst wall protein [Gregarina niphandrodes]EZG72993.1 putative oocyst wall protein [Gregarina niphandrodes]|eukprot:XP_011129688.1 putative oocyst wall protein [Gregarina niphandrodes]